VWESPTTSASWSSFNVALSEHERTVKARVFVNAEGAPVDVGERRLPTRAQAVWHLPQGELPYADFTLDPRTLAFNVAPGG
jgi:hypothetical protein